MGDQLINRQSSPEEESRPDASQLRLPFSFAKRFGVFFEAVGDDFIVYYHGKLKIELLSELGRYLSATFQLKQVSTETFDAYLLSYEQGFGGSSDAINDLELDQTLGDLPEEEDLMDSADEAPIIRAINILLTEAIKREASDIHIEQLEHKAIRVRFRVDGSLQTQDFLTKNRGLGARLVSRIKVMSKLDITENRLPQDGSFSLKIAGRGVDVRISTIPTKHGERVVLRLLDKQKGKLDLSHLGMGADIRQQVDQIMSLPHGIFLVTGPTGSGKTTTLYAGLSQINGAERNVMTVEDPIEYELEGIAQTQVNPKVEMTFFNGLKAILRQDPDVVMVGEIRDSETADIAVQASLTGHLVLSTLHTNSSVGAVTRLRDMGVEPFLLSSSLVGVLAQRLARKLCKDCCELVPISDQARVLLATVADQGIYQAVGCSSCNQTGYKGRVGLYELLVVDNQLKDMIHEKQGEKAMLEYAMQQGFKTLRAEAIDKVLDGVISIEEMIRITKDN